MPEVAQRFPFSNYPMGWFQVAYSRDVVEGAVVSLHYFGRQADLLPRRIRQPRTCSTPTVPHLGADIAVGGTVREDCVVCPFHGWKFNGRGANVEIPYTKAPNRVGEVAGLADRRAGGHHLRLVLARRR